MSTHQNKVQFHQNKIKELDVAINEISEKSNNFQRTRLILLVLGLIGCFLVWKYGLMAIFGIINTVIIGFIITSFKETKLINKSNFLKNRRLVFQRELQLLNKNFEGLEEGKEFVIPGHNYSHDLDVFGFKSLFQILNRTSTFKGKRQLGKWLNSPLTSPKKIIRKQNAVKELSAKENWCYELVAFGKSSNDKVETQEIIDDWLKDKPVFNFSFIKWIGILLPIATLTAGTLAFLDIIETTSFTVAFFIQLGLSARYASRISKIQGRLGSRFAIIENYIKIVQSIENETFNSEYLKNLQHEFKNEKLSYSVSKSLNQLKKLLDKLDARLNIYLAILLNGLFLWDINIAFQVEAWKKNHKKNLINWMNAVGEFDALISLSLFAANHSKYTFPRVKEHGKDLICESIGHPLIEDDKLVTNNYSILGDGKIDLLTGANMAGKSTFLRTIGVNLILARIGATVCAKEFTFFPFKLFSSLRTVDSLKDNESFFYAELKRLKQLINLYNEGEQFFFLLDEILKGTNSADQHKGSVGLIENLLSLKGTGVIATHDIELSNLEKQYPKSMRNICFEIEIINNQLKFDYKVKPGFCKTMNASFLMESMGIIKSSQVNKTVVNRT